MKDGKYHLRYKSAGCIRYGVAIDVIDNDIMLDSSNISDACLEAKEILANIVSGKMEGKASLHISSKSKIGSLIIIEPYVVLEMQIFL